MPAVAPYSGDEYNLINGECVKRGKVVRISKQSDGRRRANLAYDRLVAAFNRLKTVVELSKALTNKEIAKFTDQINDLCDKYARKTNNK